MAKRLRTAKLRVEAFPVVASCVKEESCNGQCSSSFTNAQVHLPQPKSEYPFSEDVLVNRDVAASTLRAMMGKKYRAYDTVHVHDAAHECALLREASDSVTIEGHQVVMKACLWGDQCCVYKLPGWPSTAQPLIQWYSPDELRSWDRVMNLCNEDAPDRMCVLCQRYYATKTVLGSIQQPDAMQRFIAGLTLVPWRVPVDTSGGYKAEYTMKPHPGNGLAGPFPRWDARVMFPVWDAALGAYRVDQSQMMWVPPTQSHVLRRDAAVSQLIVDSTSSQQLF